MASLGNMRGRSTARVLWGVMATLALLVLAAQVALQLVFTIGEADWAMEERARDILQLVGFARRETFLGYVGVRSS